MMRCIIEMEGRLTSKKNYIFLLILSWLSYDGGGGRGDMRPKAAGMIVGGMRCAPPPHSLLVSTSSADAVSIV